MALPENLAPALTDGVVLCHLANHIKPRSVASIHVPSPAVVRILLKKRIYFFNEHVSQSSLWRGAGGTWTTSSKLAAKSEWTR